MERLTRQNNGRQRDMQSNQNGAWNGAWNQMGQPMDMFNGGIAQDDLT